MNAALTPLILRNFPSIWLSGVWVLAAGSGQSLCEAAPSLTWAVTLSADTAVSVRQVLLAVLSSSEERLSPFPPSALLWRKSVQSMPVYPKLLPCCTVLAVDSLVKWSVGLGKGKEKGNGKRESGWKTTSHILQKWLMLQKESCLQQVSSKPHKSEINKMLWLQCYFLSWIYLLFSLSLTSQIPTPALWCQHTLVFLIFMLFMCSLCWYSSSLSTCSTCSFDGQRTLASPLLWANTPWTLPLLSISASSLLFWGYVLEHASPGQSHWLPHCLPFHTSLAEGRLGIFRALSPAAPSAPMWRQCFGNLWWCSVLCCHSKSMRSYRFLYYLYLFL